MLTIDLIGISIILGGIAANIDNGKSFVLFMLAAMYGVMRFVFTWKQKSQAVREKEIQLREREIELWHKEQDRRDRIDKTSRGVA